MKANRFKILSVLALFLIGFLAVSGIANADSVPVTIEEVKINGDVFDLVGDELRGDLVRDDELIVKVKINALADDNNVVVKAEIDGLDHDEDQAEDETDPFSVKEGRSYWKTLNLKLPDRMDVDQYALRIEVSNRADDEEVEVVAMLDVTTPRDAMTIKDVVLSPEEFVKAGRALLANVRVKNVGEKDQDGVRVRVSIPDLGISDSDWIDEIEAEDSVTSEELYMRIPQCAEAGDYEVVVTVEYDDGDEEVETTELITVVEGDMCDIGSDEDAGQTIITVGSDVQEVVAGESGVVYPVSLSNTGSTSRTYQIAVQAGDWADVRVSPNVVVLDSEETKMVYVYVSAKEDATPGVQTFGVEVKSGDEVLQEVVLSANVAEPTDTGSSLKRVLEVGLVVLVIALVVVGLVVGFKRLKEDSEEVSETGEEQTYY
ncbi:hypothetical protein KY343_05825 [Candidatus Woesearchaeota archaeon]|nr:hypothetical protein [Candidatus Woesearchaeota archaeon]